MNENNVIKRKSKIALICGVFNWLTFLTFVILLFTEGKQLSSMSSVSVLLFIYILLLSWITSVAGVILGGKRKQSL